MFHLFYSVPRYIESEIINIPLKSEIVLNFLKFSNNFINKILKENYEIF